MLNENIPSRKKKEDILCMSKDLDIRKNVKHLGKTAKFVVPYRGFVCGLVSAVSFQFFSFE